MISDIHFLWGQFILFLQVQNCAARRINFHYRHRSVGMWVETYSLQIQTLPWSPITFHYRYRLQAQNKLVLQKIRLQHRDLYSMILQRLCWRVCLSVVGIHWETCTHHWLYGMHLPFLWDTPPIGMTYFSVMYRELPSTPPGPPPLKLTYATKNSWGITCGTIATNMRNFLRNDLPEGFNYFLGSYENFV